MFLIKVILTFFLALLLQFEIFAFEDPNQGSRYTPPFDVNLHYWDLCEPYFMPKNHSIKPELDKLFSRRITSDLKTLKKAGFKCKKLRHWNNAVVAKHSKFKGYIFKIYLDDQPGVWEAGNWIGRIQGAAAIREVLRKHKYQKKFKVPHKWIYPLPEDDVVVTNGTKKFFILVAEDMEILDDLYNENFWNHPMLSFSLLEALFTILDEAGLYDSVYIDNIPICRDGKIAFIDTEHYHKWPVPFHKLSHFLSSEQREYWETLVQYR